MPPVPADTFVLLGAFLSGSGWIDPWVVFLVTWIPNVLSALLVYALARRYGQGFFNSRIGRRLLQPQQLEDVGRFYDRWGTPAIFVSRFLPAFRAVVPVFAGVAHVSFPRVFLPVTVASAIWYGTLVVMGAVLGRNWSTIVETFTRMSGVLGWSATICMVLVVAWWIRTRRGRA